jgi:hypothetical protein
MHEWDENYIQSLVEKAERNTQFGRSRRRLKNNIKMDLKIQGVRVWTGFT